MLINVFRKFYSLQSSSHPSNMQNFDLAKRDGTNAEAHLVVLHRQHRLVSYTDMVPKGYRRSIDGRGTALWRLELNTLPRRLGSRRG